MPSQMSCPESFYGWNPKQPSENPLCTSDSKSLPKCSLRSTHKRLIFRNFLPRERFQWNAIQFLTFGRLQHKYGLLSYWHAFASNDVINSYSYHLLSRNKIITGGIQRIILYPIVINSYSHHLLSRNKIITGEIQRIILYPIVINSYSHHLLSRKKIITGGIQRIFLYPIVINSYSYHLLSRNKIITGEIQRIILYPITFWEANLQFAQELFFDVHRKSIA